MHKSLSILLMAAFVTPAQAQSALRCKDVHLASQMLGRANLESLRPHRAEYRFLRGYFQRAAIEMLSSSARAANFIQTSARCMSRDLANAHRALATYSACSISDAKTTRYKPSTERAAQAREWAHPLSPVLATSALPAVATLEGLTAHQLFVGMAGSSLPQVTTAAAFSSAGAAATAASAATLAAAYGYAIGRLVIDLDDGYNDGRFQNLLRSLPLSPAAELTPLRDVNSIQKIADRIWGKTEAERISIEADVIAVRLLAGFRHELKAAGNAPARECSTASEVATATSSSGASSESAD